MNIGNVRSNLGDNENALVEYQKALDIQIKSLGGSHESVASTKNNIGQVLRKQGRRAEAMAMYQEARKIWRVSLGECHSAYALALGNGAKMHLLDG